MAKHDNNPYDPDVLKEGLYSEPLIPLNNKGPLYDTTCSKFGVDCVELMQNFGLTSTNYVHVWPKIDRRRGMVTDIITIISFDASMGNKDIWIKGDGGGGNNQPKMITQYKNTRTSGNKFGLSDIWKQTIGGIAANFDDNGNIVVDGATEEQIKQDRRFRNFAYVEIDFYKLMGLILGIKSDDPYDFSVDFEEGKMVGDHEDCYMMIHKFVGKRKSNNFRYQKFDSRVMTEGLEAAYGGENGRRRR